MGIFAGPCRAVCFPLFRWERSTVGWGCHMTQWISVVSWHGILFLLRSTWTAEALRLVSEWTWVIELGGSTDVLRSGWSLFSIPCGRPQASEGTAFCGPALAWGKLYHRWGPVQSGRFIGLRVHELCPRIVNQLTWKGPLVFESVLKMKINGKKQWKQLYVFEKTYQKVSWGV